MEERWQGIHSHALAGGILNDGGSSYFFARSC